MKRGLLAFMLAMFSAPMAIAGFSITGQSHAEDENSEPEFAMPSGFERIADNAYRSVIEFGSGDPEIKEGYGIDVPFVTAVSMIIPDYWVAYSDPSINIPDSITWLGGVEWTRELKRVGNAYDLQFVVLWDEQKVIVRKGSDMTRLPVNATYEEDFTGFTEQEPRTTLIPDHPVFYINDDHQDEGELYYVHEEQQYRIVIE